jgi:hypothetical protein
VAPTNLEQLPRIVSDVDSSLLDKIRTIVAARRDADNGEGSAAASILAMTIHGRHKHHGTMNPFCFGRAILPFLSGYSDAQSPIQALIPIAQTVGESHRWSPQNGAIEARNGNVNEFVAFLLHPDRASGDSNSRAMVLWIRPLGLFLSHEGKNRVAFLAAHGEEWMPAEVTPCGYPPADTLELYEVEECGETVVVCVKENRYAVMVRNPAWTLPILRAYGVKEARELIRADEVLAGIRQLESNRNRMRTTHNTGFDMSTLLTPEEKEHAYAPQSLATHEGLSISYRSIVWPLAVTVLIFFVGMLLTRHGFTDQITRIAGLVMLVGSSGVFAGFIACLYRVKVSVIDFTQQGQGRRRYRQP